MFAGCGPGSQLCLEVWSHDVVHAIDGRVVPKPVDRYASYAQIATKGFDPDLEPDFAAILKAVSNCLRWGGDWNGDPIDRVMINLCSE